MKNKYKYLKLIEIGPRLCLELVKVFDGVVGGKVIFKNNNYKTATQVRIERNRKIKKKNKIKYVKKVKKL